MVQLLPGFQRYTNIFSNKIILHNIIRPQTDGIYKCCAVSAYATKEFFIFILFCSDCLSFFVFCFRKITIRLQYTQTMHNAGQHYVHWKNWTILHFNHGRCTATCCRHRRSVIARTFPFSSRFILQTMTGRKMIELPISGKCSSTQF